MKQLQIFLTILIIFSITTCIYSQDITSDTTLANKYYALANTFKNSYKFDSALIYIEKAQPLYIKYLGENSFKNSNCLNLIGITYYYTSELDSALIFWLKCLKIRLALLGEKNIDVAKSYNNIGNVYLSKSQNDKALEYYFKTLEIQLELLGKNNIYFGLLYNNIGAVYINKLEYDKALEYYLKSLEIRLENFGEKNIDVSQSYNNIGIIYVYKLDYDKALEYHLKSLNIKIELLGEKNTLVATSYENIGIVYNYKLDYDKALEYFFKKLEINRELLGEKDATTIFSYTNIGNIYVNKLEYDKAFEYFFKSLKISLSLFGEKHKYVAANYNNIAGTYVKKNEFDKALEYYQKEAASCLWNFNDTDNVCSVPQIKDYLDWYYLLEALRLKAQIFADPIKSLQGLNNIVRLQTALQHYQACDTLITQVRNQITTESDKISLGEQANLIYNQAIELSYKLYENTLDLDKKMVMKQLCFTFSEKSKNRIMLDAIAQKNASAKAQIPDSLIEKESNSLTQISDYQNAVSEELDSALIIEYKNELFDLKREHENLIENFKINYPQYAKLKYEAKVPQIAEIQKVIDSETAVRSYSICDSVIYMFTITKNSFKIDSIAKNMDFANEIINFKNAIQKTDKNNNATLVKNSQIVYKQLFPAYADFDSNIKNIVIIPDDSLSLIPFEALINEDYNGDINNISDYPFLLKKYNITYSPSVTLYYNLKTSPANNPKYDIAILAPVFSGKDTLINQKTESLEEADINRSYVEYNETTNERYIKPLLYTENEANSIFKIYGKRKAQLCMFYAADENFIKSNKISEFRIIHFATHAISNSNESNLCGIVLAQDTVGGEDGFLHANEIYNLNLKSDLVTLSACETAVGKVINGEGVMDLSRAFFYAGTKNVIASLWKVEDKSTSELMINFYKNYNDKNQTISSSLQNAKLSMLNSENEKYRHPKYWATFLLIGN